MIKLCINCQTENPLEAVFCTECGMSLMNMPVGDEAVKYRERIARAKSLLLTTGFEFQHRPITEYLDVVTAEVVIGTGLLTEFLGSWADFFGTTSGAFERKLEDAKDAALGKLRARAVQLDADGIIGIDMDYMTIGQNMLMAVASGTAVKLRADSAGLLHASLPPLHDTQANHDSRIQR